jgi:hypothetical protein
VNNIETMRLALEALETMQNAIYNIGGEHVTDLGYAVEKADVAEQAITALRQAINAAEQREQAQQAEPWEKFCDSNCVWTDHHPDCKLAERLPLTDERIAKEVEAELTHYWNGEYIDTTGARDQLTAFARAIEAAHGIKEKNNA